VVLPELALSVGRKAGLRGEVKWNFAKFLVNPDGHVVARFDPATSPLDPEVTSAIERVLPAVVRVVQEELNRIPDGGRV
jgi:hypothetical protein